MRIVVYAAAAVAIVLGAGTLAYSQLGKKSAPRATAVAVTDKAKPSVSEPKVDVIAGAIAASPTLAPPAKPSTAKPLIEPVRPPASIPKQMADAKTESKTATKVAAKPKSKSKPKAPLQLAPPKKVV